MTINKDQLAALGMVTRAETVERLRSVSLNTDAWPNLLASQQWAILDAADRLEWQPIETAPKDGTHILLLAEGSVIEGWYPQEKYFNGEWRVISCSPHGCGCCSSSLDTPTHWMPLPDPPVNGDRDR